MSEGQARAVRPVKAFVVRLAVQIAISGSAMAAIHFGVRMAPDLGPWFGLEPQVVASVEAPPPPRPVVFVVQPPADRGRVEMAAASPAAGSPAPPTLPVPEAAPQRPVRPAGASEPKGKGVQRFDACQPACPSQDPLLRRETTLLASAAPAAAPVSDRGTDYPDVLDDGQEEGSGSLLDLPGRAIGAAGRTVGNAWSTVGSLLPFD